ncbi:unnamed protein product, partial [Nesidiocoris tenuis]
MKLSDEDDVASESAGGLGTSDEISQADPNDEPAGVSSTQTQSSGPSSMGEGGQMPETSGDPGKPQWPSMVDLNHRLRRVINSYQRNFKKEELKMAQKAK